MPLLIVWGDLVMFQDTEGKAAVQSIAGIRGDSSKIRMSHCSGFTQLLLDVPSEWKRKMFRERCRLPG